MIKLSKSSQIWLLTGIIGLAIFIAFYTYSFPTASIDINLTHKQAYEQSDAFLTAQGFNISAFEKAAIFGDCDTTYLQKNVGTKETNRIIKEEMPCWAWDIRYFQESKKDGFDVSVHPSTGEIIYFDQVIMDDAKGADLSEDEAKHMAIAFITAQGKNIENYELSDKSIQKQRNRTDHHFIWEHKTYKINEALYKIHVDIYGDTLGGYDAYLDIPEQFQRDLIKESEPGMVLSFIFGAFMVFLFIASIVVLMKQYKHSSINWKLARFFGLILIPVGIVAFFNNLPLFWYFYPDTTSKSLYFMLGFFGIILGVAFQGLTFFLFCASGESLARDLKLKTFPLIEEFKKPVINVNNIANVYVVGYSLGFCFLGYVTLFYIAGTNFFDVWMPMSSAQSTILGTSMPFLFPLTISAAAAISEEFMFRMFGIALFKKLFKKIWIGVLLTAVLWGFAHSGYAVYPNYVRGIELTLVGIAFGIVYLKYGVEATLIAHYVIDAVLIGWPLLASENLYFKTSGLIVVVLAFTPLLLIPFMKQKRHLQNLRN